MKPTNVTGYPFSNGDRLTAISVNQICNALDAIQDYNDTIKEFEDLLHEEISSTTESTVVAVNEAVGKMDSVSLASDVAQGKVNIAEAIVTKGGTADSQESFQELAQDIEDMPVYYEMLRLFAIVCSAAYNKNATQGLQENTLYGYDYIDDSGLDFDYDITSSYLFQNWSLLKTVKLNHVKTVSGVALFNNCTSLQSIQANSLTTGIFQLNGCTQLRVIEFPLLKTILNVSWTVFQGCSSLSRLYLPELTDYTGNGQNDLSGCYALEEIILPKLSNMGRGYWLRNTTTSLKNIVFGTLTNLNAYCLIENQPNLRNITIGTDTNISLPFYIWTATNVIAEGQSGIDELNDNLYNNLLTKLYDHSNDGETRTLRIGWLSRVTAENIAYANAKGWTLTT